MLFVGLNLPDLANAGKVSPGDDVKYSGQILRISTYLVGDAAEVTRYSVSRPTINNKKVRSAWLRVCTGPSAEACDSVGLDMVSIAPGVVLGSKIKGRALVTNISKKLYYETYYLNATSDVLPAKR